MPIKFEILNFLNSIEDKFFFFIAMWVMMQGLVIIAIALSKVLSPNLYNKTAFINIFKSATLAAAALTIILTPTENPWFDGTIIIILIATIFSIKTKKEVDSK